jgi:hypothetical protein
VEAGSKRASMNDQTEDPYKFPPPPMTAGCCCKRVEGQARTAWWLEQGLGSWYSRGTPGVGGPGTEAKRWPVHRPAGINEEIARRSPQKTHPARALDLRRRRSARAVVHKDDKVCLSSRLEHADVVTKCDSGRCNVWPAMMDSRRSLVE